jgi:phosphatidylserine/phosphatidylglycerophosphate/cardiolipin synthase-like enzyme
LKIAVTWFTNHDIFDAVIEKLKNPDFKVYLIVLNDRINNKREGIDFQKLIDLNGNFYFSNNENMVHHKFCIIDDCIVITGSYNWTYYAENRNWENVVILSDEEIVKGYVEEFEKVINSHEKIENIASTRNTDAAVTSNDYLLTDYTLPERHY